MEEKIDICRTLELSVFVYTLSRRCHRQLIVCMKLHQLPVLDVFFCLLRLSERAHKGHTTFISSSSSFSFLMLDFLINSYIVVWILVHLLLSELYNIKSSITSHLSSVLGWCLIYLIIYVPEADTPDWIELNQLTSWLPLSNDFNLLSWLLWLNQSIRLTVW